MAETENKVTMETPSIAKVSLKLLIDTKGNRVLFAEAGKDFVDFLFNLLHLPLGTVVRLITEQSPMGNLYESIQNMSETYFVSNQTKDSLLKPKPTFSATEVPLLPLDSSTSLPKKYYTCPRNPSISNGHGPFNYHGYVAGDPHAVCPSCGKSLSKEILYVSAVNEVGEGGFVKGVVTYTVTDDLVVTPASPISSITMLLDRFNVKEMGAVEERVVDLGMPEALKLLKAMSHTKKVLTSVFLENDTGA